MNQREKQRITTLSLPSEQEKDLSVIIRRFVDSIKSLFGRDEDKEKRITVIEQLCTRGTGKFQTEKYIGDFWRFVVLDISGNIVSIDDGTNDLYLQHKSLSGIWLTKATYTH